MLYTKQKKSPKGFLIVPPWTVSLLKQVEGRTTLESEALGTIRRILEEPINLFFPPRLYKVWLLNKETNAVIQF